MMKIHHLTESELWEIYNKLLGAVEVREILEKYLKSDEGELSK